MSSATTEATVGFYNDGPDWPTTPELLAAERAYRDAFLAGAREAAAWPFPDAWPSRMLARHASGPGKSTRPKGKARLGRTTAGLTNARRQP